jgi:hypothetical protein
MDSEDYVMGTFNEMELKKEEPLACPVERGVIKLVICSKTQDGCEGCEHAEEHEPYTMKNGNKCGMDGFCDIHCTDVSCKEVL